MYRALVARHGNKQINELLNEDEQAMLLAKQSLTQQAKKHFGLFDNPFTNEVRAVEELFLNSDINYVGIHHELSQIIGYSKLQLLSEHLGNNSIEVPMATTITIAMRNRTIREMAAKKKAALKSPANLA
ncbi:hypothetical protein NCW36_10730 [Acinetobacter pittii]|nr:hypothetical protein [Acinetobacter pittii]